MNSLLPPNSTELERRLAEANSDISSLPVNIRDLFNPWLCPFEFLPYLANSRSVDHWNESWPEKVKRQVIADSFFVHQKKGTRSAISRVISAFGYSCTIKEWFETVPQNIPGTFSLDISINEQGISEEIYNELYRLIFDAKPVSRHYFSFGLSLKTEGNLYTGASICDGEIINIYTDTIKEIHVYQKTTSFAIQTEHDITTIKGLLNG